MYDVEIDACFIVLLAYMIRNSAVDTVCRLGYDNRGNVVSFPADVRIFLFSRTS